MAKRPESTANETPNGADGTRTASRRSRGGRPRSSGLTAVRVQTIPMDAEAYAEAVEHLTAVLRPAVAPDHTAADVGTTDGTSAAVPAAA